MDQVGGTSEPQQSDGDGDGDGNGATTSGDGGRDGQGLIVVGIVVLVVLLAFGAWMAGNDDLGGTVARSAERFPETSVVVSTPADGSSTTVATAASTPIATTTPVLPAPDTTPVATPPPTPAPTDPPPTDRRRRRPRRPRPRPRSPRRPPSPRRRPSPRPPCRRSASLAIDEVVPNVAAFPEHLANPEAVRTAIAALLANPRHDVASAEPVATLCAAVALDGPIDVSGRWEHDGRKVASTKLTFQNVPGYGDCYDDDGDPLADGSYQFIATDRDGGESAAANFVVGSGAVDQRFVNDGDGRTVRDRDRPEEQPLLRDL